MKRTGCNLLILLGLFFVCQAQAVSASRFTVGLRGGYYLIPNWADTYDVVYDNGGEMVYGLEVAFRISDRIEIALAGEMISGEGERVWPDGSGNWAKTGESITFDMLPMTVLTRFFFLNKAVLSPYIGGGIGYNSFQETDEDGVSGFGFSAMAGIRWQGSNPLELLAEAEFSSYPSVIGEGDLSQYFGDDDIGGISLRLCLRYAI